MHTWLRDFTQCFIRPLTVFWYHFMHACKLRVERKTTKKQNYIT